MSTRDEKAERAFLEDVASRLEKSLGAKLKDAAGWISGEIFEDRPEEFWLLVETLRAKGHPTVADMLLAESDLRDASESLRDAESHHSEMYSGQQKAFEAAVAAAAKSR